MSFDVLLIDPSGNNLGTMSREAAQRVADEQFGLDLVEVRPGVFKILNAGKLAYEASKRKTVKTKPTKEIKFKLNIGESDFDIKIGHIRRFLGEGSLVRVIIWFSGREVSRPETGIKMLESIAEATADISTAALNRELQGKNMTMVITPGKKNG